MAELRELSVEIAGAAQATAEKYETPRLAQLFAGIAAENGRFCGIDFQITEVNLGVERTQFDGAALQGVPRLIVLPQSPEDTASSTLTVRYNAPGLMGLRDYKALVKQLQKVGTDILGKLGLQPHPYYPFVLDVGDDVTVCCPFL